MRILHCVGRMDRGGIESFTIAVLRNLDWSALEVDLLCTIFGDGVYDEEASSLGARLYKFDSGFYRSKTPFKQIVQLWYYIRFFRKHEYDVYHFHSSHSFDAFVQFVAARMTGKRRLVFHSHTTSGSHRRLNRLFARFLGRASVVRIACSNDAGVWLFGRKSSWAIVKNGIDTSRFEYSEQARTEVRRELSVSDETYLLMMVGRLVPVKNHGFMIRVMSKIMENGADIVLAIVGDGPLRLETERLVRHYGLSNHVRFLGMREDIHRLMSAADCFVMPSLYEGLPVAGIEAQASGLPCVFSTNVSGEADVGDVSCSFLPVNDENVETWVEEVRTLSHSRPRRIGAAERVSDSGYDIKDSVGHLFRLYLDMMERQL